MGHIVASCGIVGALALSATVQLMSPASTSSSQAPAWVVLPASAKVVAMSNGQSGGSIDLSFDHPADSELSAFKTKLASEGFAIKDNAAVPGGGGIQSAADAVNHLSGQALSLLVSEEPDGDRWHIVFKSAPSTRQATN
jgi:hypothetical protein